jgi:hypothetical protein
MNFPILQLQELHRSRAFPDVDHPSKALSNVFPEKRQGGIFARLHMPVCRFSSPLPAAASTGISPGQWPGEKTSGDTQEESAADGDEGRREGRAVAGSD